MEVAYPNVAYPNLQPKHEDVESGPGFTTTKMIEITPPPSQEGDDDNTGEASAVPISQIKAAMKELDAHEKGFDTIFLIASLMILFFYTWTLRADTQFVNSLDAGMKSLFERVTFDEGRTLYDVRNYEDFGDWLSSFAMDAYRGDEKEDPCWLCSIAYSNCNPCFSSNGTLYDYSGCEYCAQFSQCYSSSLMSACTNFTGSTYQGEYYYKDWRNDDLPSCSGLDLQYSKGLTSQGYNLMSGASSVFNYSQYGGKVANQNKIGAVGIITFQKRKTKPCLNEAVQTTYGDCIDSGTAYSHSIPVNDTSDFIVPRQRISYFSSIGEHGTILDLGAYGFGGWAGYCIGQVFKDQYDILENVEHIEILLVSINVNKEVLSAASQVSFGFSSGGDTTAEVSIVGISTKEPLKNSADLTYMILVHAVFMLPAVIFFLGITVKFAIDSYGLSFKKKIMLLKYSLNRSALIYILSFGYCLCQYIAVMYSHVYTSMVSEALPFGQDINGNSVNDVLEKFVQIGALTETALTTVKACEILFFFGCLMALFFIIDLMKFHKRIALINEVLNNIMMDFYHFCIVLLIVIVVYSTLFQTLFGPFLENFNSFSATFTVLIRIALGDPGEYYDELLGVTTYGALAGPLLVYTFQLVVALILLNIVVSICVNAYVMYLENVEEDYWTVLESLAFYIDRKARRLTGCLRNGGPNRGHGRSTRHMCDFILQLNVRKSLINSPGSEKMVNQSLAISLLKMTPCSEMVAKKWVDRIIVARQSRKEKKEVK